MPMPVVISHGKRSSGFTTPPTGIFFRSFHSFMF
jgi:hypothetical protein